MNILLTGATGFIGRNLYEAFKDKYPLFTPSHRELDLLDYKKVEAYIKRKKIKIVIHTAIKGGENVFKDTLRMFTNLTRNLDRLDKLIHLGSGAEYEKKRNLVKVNETEFGRYIPQDDYGFTKYLCSQIARYEKKIVTLRLFGIYGRYEDYRYKFISNAIVKNLLGLPIKIKQNVIFDYLYVDDFTSIVEHFLKKRTYFHDYNVTPTHSIRLTDIVKVINSIGRKKSKVHVVTKGLNYQYTGENRRLRRQIPRFVFTPYKEGIKQLYQFYEQRIDSVDRDEVIQDDYLKISKVKI